jgi:nonribosomal peptide synthetase MxcG
VRQQTSVADPPTGCLELTAAQQSIWTAQILIPGSSLFNAAEYTRIDGPLDLGCFERALRQAVSEAEALHVRFDMAAGRVVQYLCAASDWRLSTIDMSDHVDPFAEALAWMHEDLGTAVGLTDGPLFRHALLILAADSYVWYHRAHHIALDGYGFALVSSRLAELYTAEINGVPDVTPKLGALGTAVADDLAYRQSAAYLHDQRFWCSRFADRPNAVGLSPRRSMPDSRLLRGNAVFPNETMDTWHEWASRSDATWVDVVLALIAMYLAQVSDADEVVLGVLFSGRMRPIVARTPVMIMNVLPLRVRVRDCATLADVIHAVARELQTIRPHQRYRGEQLRRELQLVGGEHRLYGPVINILPFDYRPGFAGCKGVTSNLSAGAQFTEDMIIHLYLPSTGEPVLDIDANPNCYRPAELADHLDGLTEMLIYGPPGQTGSRRRGTISHSVLWLPGGRPC